MPCCFSPLSCEINIFDGRENEHNKYKASTHAYNRGTDPLDRTIHVVKTSHARNNNENTKHAYAEIHPQILHNLEQILQMHRRLSISTFFTI